MNGYRGKLKKPKIILIICIPIFLLLISFQNFRFNTLIEKLIEPNLGRRGELGVKLGPLRNAIPMATTPDGRVIVNRLIRDSKSPLRITFQPLKQFGASDNWENSQILDSLMSTMPRGEILVPDSMIEYDPTEEDLYNRYYSGVEIPSGFQLRPTGIGLRQGTVFFDGRFGENAFSVKDPQLCLSNTEDKSISLTTPGDYLCYKMIVMIPIAIGPRKIDESAPDFAEQDRYTFHRTFQARFSFVVKVKTTVFGKSVILSEPFVPSGGAVLHEPLRLSLAKGPNGIDPYPMMGLEISSVSDGRLIIWNEGGEPSRPYGFDSKKLEGFDRALAMFSVNETPYNRKSWTRPAYFQDLNKYYGNYLICPTTQESCLNKVPLKSIYRLAEKSFKSGDGADLAAQYRCAYGWLTPDGSHAMCGFSAINTGLIGPGTNFILRAIDAPINAFSEIAKLPVINGGVFGTEFCTLPTQQNCYRPPNQPSNFRFEPGKRLTERPQMPLGLGSSFGFWRSLPEARPKNLLLSERQPSFQMFLRNDLLGIYRPPKVNLDGNIDNTTKLVTRIEEKATFEYAEVTTAFGDDKDFVFYYQMDEATNSMGNPKKGILGDSSGNFLLGEVDSSKVLSELDYYKEKYSYQPGTPVPSAQHELIFSAEGFQGQGRILKSSGVIQVSTSVRGANAGFLSSDVSNFSFELAIRPLIDLSNTNLRLAEWNGVFQLDLYQGKILLRLLKDSSAPLDLETIELQGLLQEGRYMHIGISFQGLVPGKLGLAEIYVDGVSRKSTAHNIRSMQGGGLFTIGPNSQCIGCAAANNNLLMIDEVGLSKVTRNDRYFRVAAHRKKVDQNAMSKLYPHVLPPGFSPTDVQIPQPLGEYMQKNEYKFIVRLGRKLFGDPILSTYETLPSSTNRGISCQTCHRPTLAFTDGNARSIGVNGKILNFNTPTMINRIFAKEQFFDERAENLYKQVIHPVTNPDEMGGKWSAILAALSAQPLYQKRFALAFPDSPTPSIEKVQIALAAFSASIKSGVDIEAKMSDPLFAKGFQIFNNKGRCVACHSGPNFSDEIGHDTSGLGKKIKTPTLHNIRKTHPYMHDGKLKTLEQVVMSYVNPTINENTDREIRPLDLGDSDVAALVHFLKNLDGEVTFAND